MRSTSDTHRIIKAIIVILLQRKRQRPRRCVACKLNIMLSRAFSPRQKKENVHLVAGLAAREITAWTVFVTSNNYFTIVTIVPLKDPLASRGHADVMNYAISPDDDPSVIANARNRGNAIPVFQKWHNEWQKRTINLSPRLRRAHALKVISLARHAHVYNRGEDKESIPSCCDYAI